MMMDCAGLTFSSLDKVINFTILHFDTWMKDLYMPNCLDTSTKT